jgi:hypothetical protein
VRLSFENLRAFYADWPGAIIRDSVWIHQAQAALSSVDLHIAERWRKIELVTGR